MRLHNNNFSIPPLVEEGYKNLLVNKIYKLLPIREEGNDWLSYLESLLREINGLLKLFDEKDNAYLVSVLGKLSSLRDMQADDDFFEYRKIILECTNSIK